MCSAKIKPGPVKCSQSNTFLLNCLIGISGGCVELTEVSSLHQGPCWDKDSECSTGITVR